MKNVNISSLTCGEVFNKTFLEKSCSRKLIFNSIFFTNVNIVNIYYWRNNEI